MTEDGIRYQAACGALNAAADDLRIAKAMARAGLCSSSLRNCPSSRWARA